MNEGRRALIVYGTRYGATRGTSEEIAGVLRDEGFDVRVVDAKEENVDEIREYDLVVVGSGIKQDRWTGGPERFLKEHREELATKNVALFVSSGWTATAERLGQPEVIERNRKKYLEEKAARYGLKPLAIGLFGGIWDRSTFPGWWRPASLVFDIFKVEEQIAQAGFEEVAPGVFDARNWDDIRNWASQLAADVRNGPAD